MSIISSINKFAVRADKACDYIPVVSTLSNLVDLFQKCVVLPLMSSSTTSLSRYYQHLQGKSISRSILLLIPFIGNFIVSINDNIANDLDSTHYMLSWIKDCGDEAFKYASARLKKDENFLVEACKIRPSIFNCIDASIRDSRRFRRRLFEDVCSDLEMHVNKQPAQPSSAEASSAEPSSAQSLLFIGYQWKWVESAPECRTPTQWKRVLYAVCIDVKKFKELKEEFIRGDVKEYSTDFQVRVRSDALKIQPVTTTQTQAIESSIAAEEKKRAEKWQKWEDESKEFFSRVPRSFSS